MNNSDQRDLPLDAAEKYSFSVMDRIIAWVAVVLGYLFVRILPVRENRLAAVLFLVALWGTVFAWLYFSGVRPTVRSYIFAGGAIAVIPALLTSSDDFMIGWMYLGQLAVLMYFISTAGGNSLEDRLGGLFAADVAGAVFVAPVAHMKAHPRAAFKGDGRGVSKKLINTLLWIALGLCLAVIPTCIISLMLSFDEGFNSIMENIFSFDIKWSVQTWRRLQSLIFGIPVAVYLYGAVIASRRGSVADKMSAEGCRALARRARCLPAAMVYAAITPILAVYVIFFISQWDVYMSAFTGVLPEGFIYSDYARKGFFQLVCVCAINAVILLGVQLFVQRKTKITAILMKIYMIVISVMTLILVATALSRMALYIKAYGLTLDRIHASWFMVVLAAAFLLTIVKQICPRLRFTPILLGCVAVLFAVMLYGNANAMVANYNADAYLDGRLDGVDVREIIDMDEAGIPALVRLSEEADDGEVRAQADKALERFHVREQNERPSFWSFNFPHARARQLIGADGK